MKFLSFTYNIYICLTIGVIRAKDACHFCFCYIVKMEDHPT